MYGQVGRSLSVPGMYQRNQVVGNQHDIHPVALHLSGKDNDLVEKLSRVATQLHKWLRKEEVIPNIFNCWRSLDIDLIATVTALPFLFQKRKGHPIHLGCVSTELR